MSSWSFLKQVPGLNCHQSQNSKFVHFLLSFWWNDWDTSDVRKFNGIDLVLLNLFEQEKWKLSCLLWQCFFNLVLKRWNFFFCLLLCCFGPGISKRNVVMSWHLCEEHELATQFLLVFFNAHGYVRITTNSADSLLPYMCVCVCEVCVCCVFTLLQKRTFWFAVSLWWKKGKLYGCWKTTHIRI